MSHILLIDDDEDMLAMTRRWLEKAGYEVSASASGKEALSLISNHKPDLILLDYAMPEMSGPEVLSAIRSHDEYSDIPVLFRTGLEDADAIEKEGSIHADGIVPKSGGKPALMEAVGKF
jgi:CheY-like chemotaxis protein